ncbi:hypothetical protein NC653_012716 [Populus alba x Populus x berolinensis]|uniref:Uncharacterized protein n=1 Tax=Populus alba x Populus x berolinensis TaxID=444605 RepID=A0AAD6QT01_9ROSI|nr:hypothetical protein NC653_012716 [Populus alba x Populus x berolinensis]
MDQDTQVFIRALNMMMCSLRFNTNPSERSKQITLVMQNISLKSFSVVVHELHEDSSNVASQSCKFPDAEPIP